MPVKNKNSEVQYSAATKKAALKDFVSHSRTVPSKIAKRNRIPTDVLVAWVEEAGLPPRKRRVKKPTVIHPDSVVRAALHDYVNHPELLTSAIARKHSISTATLTVWATNANIPLRSRGVHKQDAPTPRQQEILKLAEILSYDDVGERFGISKARVGAIVKRWKNLNQPTEPPFVPGDVIEWTNGKKRKERLTVIEANLTHGTMLDSRGRKLRSFTWSTGGRLPCKVGFNPKYAQPVKDEPMAANGHNGN